MHRFKFRCWDNIGKCMVDWLCMRQVAFNQGEISLMHRLFTDYSGDKIMMQYTGLEDKYGKEIYESDWCLCKNAEGRSFKALVVFIDGCFELHSSQPLMSSPNPKRDYLKCLTVNHAVEVIGNKYED